MVAIPLVAMLLAFLAILLTLVEVDDNPDATAMLPETSAWLARQTVPVTVDPVPIWRRTTLGMAVV